MGGPARPLHEPGNHRSSERCSHRHSADCGSLIERPTLLRITAPTPRPGARSLISLDQASSRLEKSGIPGRAFAELLVNGEPPLIGLRPGNQLRERVDL